MPRTCKRKRDIQSDSKTPEYPALPNPESGFRLLECVDAGAEVYWRLSIVSINDKPRFTALSYVWGNPDETEEVSLDGRKVSVTTNLACALRHVPNRWRAAFSRPRRYPFRLWVDALCINQADVEKNKQIPLMGTIFSSAELVISWLGLQGQEIHRAMDTIDLLYSEWVQLGPEIVNLEWMLRHPSLCIHHDSAAENPWRSLWVFTALEYWSRVWIFQEIILAKRAIVVCQDKAVEWQKLLYVAKRAYELRFILKNHVKKPEFLPMSTWIPIATRDGPSWRIFTTYGDAAELKAQVGQLDKAKAWTISLQAGRLLRATEPKDHVYGLLEVSHIQIIPDYTKRTSVATVYRDYIKVWLENWSSGNSTGHNELFFLPLSGYTHYGRNPILPSWVPNLPVISSRTGQEARVIADGSASRAVFPANTQNSSILGMSLFVSGLEVDTITSMHICCYDGFFSDSTFDYICGFISERPNYPSCTSSLQSIFRLLLFAYSARQGPLDMTAVKMAVMLLEILLLSDKKLGPSNTKRALKLLGLAEDTAESFASTFADAFAPYHPSLNRTELLYLLLSWHSWYRTSPYEKRSAMVDDTLFMTTLEQLMICEQMTLFTTSSGYIGISRQGIEVGDRLCVLKGCDSLLVLRKGDGGYHIHVCTCYVEGLANGETKEYLQSGRSRIIRFEIR